MQAKIGLNRNTALLVVVIAAIVAPLLAVSTTFTSPNAGLERAAGYFGKSWPMSSLPSEGSRIRMGFASPYRNQSWSGNVTIDSAQAKALVEAAIPRFKVGTVTSSKTSWLVPIEDEKGVVTSIQVTKVSASTAEQAKGIVEGSLKKGWKAGEPELTRTLYSVPLLDSSDVTVGYIRVDGRTGEIMRRPSTILTVTSDQAKTIASDAIREFKVGEAEDKGNVWMVSIKYKDKAVMTMLLAKLNTPTSEDAVQAVQNSIAKGWKAGEPKLLQSIYNVPIIDANGNTVGNIRVDGRSGDITTGFPALRR